MSLPLPAQSNFIAVGAWNPAIIEPGWLKKEFPTRTPEQFKLQLVTGGGAISFRLEFEDFFLDPIGGRLAFIPKKLDEKTLENIASLSNGIIEKLQHTPIAAAGCNFAFKLEADECFDIETLESDDEIKSIYSKLRPGNTFVSKSIVHAFAYEDYQLNFKYEFNGDSKTFLINYHYPQPSSMKKAADSLVPNFNDALSLIKNLTKKGKI